MLGYLKCYLKFKTEKCYKTCIRKIEEEILFLINENNELNQKINYFNELVKRNILNNGILSFDTERNIKIKRIFLPSIDNSDGYKKCSHKVDECNDEFNKLLLKHSELLNEVLNNQYKYNNIVDVVLDIKKYLKDNNTEEISKVYINFKNDRNKDLVCILYDFSKFDVNRTSMPDLVGLFGEYKFNRNKLRMLLDYSKTCGYLEIVDFFTGKPWCGHATFALECLDDIVRKANTIIQKHNRLSECEDFYANKIGEIIGSVGPDTSLMTSKQLAEFYMKRGFYGEKGFGKVIQYSEKKVKVYKDGEYVDGGRRSFYENTSDLVIKELNRLGKLGYTFDDQSLVFKNSNDLFKVGVDTIFIDTKDIVGTDHFYRYGSLEEVALSLPRLSDSLIGRVDKNGNYTKKYRDFLESNEFRGDSRLEVFTIEEEYGKYYIRTGFHRLLTAKLLNVDRILVDVEILSSNENRKGKGCDKYPRKLKEIREQELTDRINNYNKNLDEALTFEEMVEIIQGKYELMDKGSFINKDTVMNLTMQIYGEDFSRDDIENVGFRLKDNRWLESNEYRDILYHLKAIILENRIKASKIAELDNIDLYANYSSNNDDDLYYMSHVLTKAIDNDIFLNKFGNLSISNELLNETIETYEDVHYKENVKVSREFIINKLLR